MAIVERRPSISNPEASRDRAYLRYHLDELDIQPKNCPGTSYKK